MLPAKEKGVFLVVCLHCGLNGMPCKGGGGRYIYDDDGIGTYNEGRCDVCGYDDGDDDGM